MIIGGHLSIAKSLNEPLEQARQTGFNCLQIFSGPPRNWRSPRWNTKETDHFRQTAKKFGIIPIFVHAKYLINLASLNEETINKSIKSLKEDLNFATQIDSPGVIFHPHPRDIKLLLKSIRQILEVTPIKTKLILENSAQIKIEEIGEIIRLVKESEKLGFCFDTAHAFEAGYDIRQKANTDKLLKLIAKKIGLNHWLVIHTNDSKTKFNSHHDVHADIGEGELGLEPFRYLLNHPITKKLPFILETPAGKTEGLKGYQRNLNVLRKLLL